MRKQYMGYLDLTPDPASPSQSSSYGYQSGQPASHASKASLTPYGTGNGSGTAPVFRPPFLDNPKYPSMASPRQAPRIDRPCDDLLEYLRHEHLDTTRPRRVKDASTTKDSSVTMNSPATNNPFAANNSSIDKDSSTTQNPSPLKKTTPVLAEPKVRYRGVSDDPRSPSLKGVPDWYIDAHKELKAKHPYDFSHFIEGYQFYAKGPSAEGNTEQDQHEESFALSEHSYPVSPPYRSTTPTPPIVPLNHPAVDSCVPHFTPPSYGRFRYSEAVSADTFHISENLEQVRQFELSAKEREGASTSGSSYADRLRKSVKYAVLPEGYPADVLDMYDEDEPRLLCSSCRDKDSIPEICQEKDNIPEIRVQEPEEAIDPEEEDYSVLVKTKEPNKLTVPREEVPDTSGLATMALRIEPDARSVSEKSDGSANGYGDFFDYYSRTSGGSVTHDGEDLDHASVSDTTDGRKPPPYNSKDQKSFVPVLAPLFEERSRTQIQTLAVELKEEQQFYMPFHPLHGSEERVNVIPDVREATITTAVGATNTNTNKGQRVPTKPLPAYVEHGHDEYNSRHRSICDGTNFWRDDFSTETIEYRVIVEKPAPTPLLPSKRRVPKPASIVGSDSPPHEIKDTNSLRRPTIVHVEPTIDPTPPPVPPKEPLTSEFPPTPPPKTAETAYCPSQPAYGPAPHPSVADIGRGMRIEDEDIYDNTPYRDNFDTPTPRRAGPTKAMKVLGVEMNEIRQTSGFESGAFKPFTPCAGGNLEKEVNHITNRNSKLDQDESKSSKSLLGFRGGVSDLFRKRDKTAGPSNINTEAPQADKCSSVETGASSPDSPRPGLFKRLFNNKRQSDAPSTAPSIESYGGSNRNHESWDSSRASGDTGLTSNDDAFMSYGSHHTVPDSGKTSTGNTSSPADYVDDRINPNFSVKLNDKPPKTKSSLFFGREKSEDPGLTIGGVSIPVPEEEKGVSVFGFFQKDKEMEPERDDGALIEDIKKRIVEQASFERSEEFARQKQKAFDDKQKAKIIPGRKGYFNGKGEYYRAKNLLELELCDSENSEPLSFSEVKEKYEKEKPEPVKEPKRWGPPDHMPPSDRNAEREVDDFHLQPEIMFGDYDLPTPIVEEPETVVSEQPGVSRESITVKSPVTPGFSPENEPPSHWSDDSDEEDHDHDSQPPTPSNPSFGRSTKRHKRTGSGSSNLGTGPMFMKKAVRKFKANRKSAEVRASPSLASKGNRDSVMSQTSNGSNRSTPISASAPPVPPPVPARGSTDAGIRSECRASRIPVRKVSVASPPSSRLTTGTYHDQKDNVVHHFGGTIPERSGSSLGHRGDRTSMPANLPERAKSSLGHNVADERLVREGIKCTADITADDVLSFVVKKKAQGKAQLEEEQRNRRAEEIRLNEVEAKLKREKIAAKSDKRLVKEKKRHEDAIEKSKFRVGLATRLAGRLIQRESDSLKSKGVYVPSAEINGWI